MEDMMTEADETSCELDIEVLYTLNDIQYT